MECKILSDIPIGERLNITNIYNEDKLNRNDYAKLLAESLIRSQDSLTIGVYGGWGSGKTSFMQLMKNHIDSNPKIHCVWFNAWKYENESNLIIPLLLTIKNSINKSKMELFNDINSSLNNILESLVSGIDFEMGLKYEGISLLSLRFKPERIFDHYNKLSKSKTRMKCEYYEYYDQLNNLRDRIPKTIIFIDDLDRCLPENSIELIEKIKLILCQAGFSFVIGVYPKIIYKYIVSKYEKHMNLGEEERIYFEDYLEKFIQLPFYLPNAKIDDIISYTNYLLDKCEIRFNEERELEKSALVSIIVDACEYNPRRIIRFINTILISKNIANTMNIEDHSELASAISIYVRRDKYSSLLRAIEYNEVINCEGDIKIEESVAESIFGLKFTYAIINLLDKLNPRNNFYKLSLELSKLSSLNEGVTKEALALLSDNDALCSILYTEAGKKWIQDEKFRNSHSGKMAMFNTKNDDKLDIESIYHIVKDGNINPLVFPKVANALQIPYGLPKNVGKLITNLEGLTFYKGTMQIRELYLNECPNIEDISFLSEIESLKILDISNCHKIRDISGLKNLINLKDLALKNCIGIEDINPIGYLNKLETINIMGCNSIKDLTPLSELPKLRIIYLSKEMILNCIIPSSLESKLSKH